MLSDRLFRFWVRVRSAAHFWKGSNIPIRRSLRRLEYLEGRATPAGLPTVSMPNLPTEAFVGENFAFTVRFDNTHPTDTGYGPYVDIYVKTTGADGSGAATDDGLDFVSATYLGVPVSATTVTLTAAGVQHPLAVTSSGSRVTVTPPAGFEAGDKLIVLRLPFGSFTSAQPAADVQVTLSTSGLADVGTPIPVRVAGGFQYGNDALDNPTTDPSILGAAVSQNVTPTVLRLTKTYLGPEDETATGPNFPRQYRITADVAAGQTLTNLDLTDLLPANLQFVSVDSTRIGGTSVATTAVATPGTSLPGGTLTRRFASVVGTTGTNDAEMVFTAYVPLNSSTSSPVISALTGDDATAVDDAMAQGNWIPTDSRDPSAVAVSNVTANDHTLNAKSIAIQKSVSVVGDTGTTGPSPGDTLEYVLDFQVSDYFAFQNVVIDDLFSDGQSFVPGSLVLDVNDSHAGTTSSGAVGGANFTLTPNASGGSDRLVARVSDELALRGYSPGGRLVGGAIPAGGTGGPPPVSDPPLPFGATRGTLKFRTLINDTFQIDFPSGDPSVDQGDRLTNNVSVTGDLLNVADLAPVIGQSETDTSTASVSIVAGTVSKSIYAINGNTSFGSVQVKPGDTVTYRLTYQLPTSDEEALTLTDFLPLPVFSATQITGIDDVVSAAAPAAGRAKFGPADTFRAYSGLVPTLTTSSASNSVQFAYPNFDSSLNQPTTADLLFTVTVSAAPFADGLFLTNQVRSSEGSTNQGISNIDAIIQIQLTQPVLNIRKGIVSTNATSPTFTPATVAPAGVTFGAPGSSTPFTGTISSNGLATTPIDSGLSGVDAGDLVRFALVIENTGSSPNGAFDVRVRDAMPAGFVIPASGMNLTVTDGTGASIPFSSIGTGLFDAAGGIELLDPGATSTDPGSIDRYDATNGRNIAVVTYDMQVAGTVTPNQSWTNTGTLYNYAGTEGGPDHTSTDRSDTAVTTVRNVSPVKSITATSESSTSESGTGTTASPRLTAVGEIVRYRLVTEIPEGTIANAQIREQLPAGLTFLNDGTTRVAMVSDQSAWSSTNPVGSSLTLALGTGPLGTQPFVSGNDTTIAAVTPGFVLPDANIGSTNSITANSDTYNTGDDVYFKLGNLVNNDRDANREYVVIEFNALTDNSVAGSNDAGDTRDNNFQLTTGSTVLATSANVRTRVVEPTPTVTKSVSPTTGDAGDVVTYTVTVTNPTGTNAATAFNTRILDTLPALMSLNVASVAVNLAGGATGTTNSSAGSTVDVSVDTLPPGGTATITYTATLGAALTPNQVITNSAVVTETSLPGASGTAGNPTGSNVTGAAGSNTGERTGSGTAPNDLSATSAASVTVLTLSPNKSILSTSEASTAGTNVTIGEIVRYRLRVRLAESSAITNLRLQDALPTGLTYLNDGTTQVALVSNGAGIVSSTLSGAGLAITGNQSNLATITPTFVLPSASILGGPFVSGTDPIFAMGDLNNQDRDADEEYIIVDFNALVDNAGTSAANSNDLGETLNNTFNVTINGTAVGPTSAAAAVTVAEPQIANVNKTVNVVNGDAGDVVSYSVTFSNSGTATAFDLQLDDLLPTAVALNGSSINVTTSGTVTGVSTAGTSGNALQVRLASMAPGAGVTVTYQATIAATVAPGDTISNVANLVWSSLPGTNGTFPNSTGSVVPGSPGTALGERNQSGGINDYSGSDPATFSVPNGTVAKSISTTSSPFTAGNSVSIGEVVTYMVTVNLPEGTTPTIAVSDNLPLGVAYIPGSTVIDRSGFNGTVPDPTVTSAGGSGDDIQFSFGSAVVAGDNVTGNNSFRIRYQTRVLDVPGNTGTTAGSQTSLPNTATVTLGSAPTLTTNTVTTSVVEPRVGISKNVVQSSADADERVTVVLTVSNTGLAPSFETVVRDVLNTSEFAAGTVDFGTAGTDYPVGFTPSVNSGTGEVLYSNGTIAAGATAVFRFTVKLSTSVVPGQTIVNSAAVSQSTSMPGIATGERTSSSTPSSDSLTVWSNSLSGFVYVDANNDGFFGGAETPLGNVSVRLTGTDHLGNPVNRTTLTAANGAYTFAGLRPGSYSVQEVAQPSGWLDGYDSPGTLFGGTAQLPTGDQITGITIPTGGSASGANYNFGEIPAASVGNFAWEDLNGNGRQDLGEPGLSGVTVQLAGFDDFGNPQSRSTSTVAGGGYSFTDLPPGMYRLTFGAPSGYVFTRQDSAVATDLTDSDANPSTGQTMLITIDVGETDNSLDAGFYRPITVGDRVWFDTNGDGVQGVGEQGIPGASVSIVSAGPDGIFGNGDDLTLPPVVTGANGIWSVTNAPPGLLRVVVSNLPAGITAPSYDLDGTGTANQATLSVTSGTSRTDVDFGYRGTGTIGDRVWFDLNGDGLATGETGLANIGITAVWAGFDGIPSTADDQTFTVQTNASGDYLLNNLPFGSYRVSVDTSTLPLGMQASYDLDSGTVNPDGITQVTLSSGTPVVTSADFGYTGRGQIGDRLWVDINGDGVQDPNEPGIAAVVVTTTWAGPDGNLATTGDNVQASRTTDSSGNYLFTGLPAGSYRVVVASGLPAGLTITGDPQGSLDGQANVSLSIAQQLTNIDFGYQPNSSLSGYVYRDYSVDGVRQTSGPQPETGISGVTVTLTGVDILGHSINRQATTAADGSYSFGGLLAGNYSITETQPPPVSVPGGFYDGLDGIGTINGLPTGTNPVKNQLAVNLGTSQAGVEYNFGENPSADPFGYVYIDLNVNGVRDPGEPGIAGVSVTISGTAFAGTPLARPLTAADIPGGLTVTTNSQGRWEYPVMPPGVYSIVESQPAGYIDGLEENADPNGPNTVVVGNDRFDNVVLSPFPIRGPFNFGEIASNGELRGAVYVDQNRNAIRDGSEVGIAGVTMTLQGTDLGGNAVLRTAITDALGNYSFASLLPGTYSIAETHPVAYVDGIDAVGTAGGVLGNDVITTIVLGPNQLGLNYNFGELGRRSDDVDKRDFIISNR